MTSINNSFINERLTSLRNFLNEQLDIVQKELVDNYNTHMNEYQTTIVDKTEEITGLSNQVNELTIKNNRLNEENLNYQKVSLVKSLNTQLSEKDGEIKFLKSKINQLNDMVEKLRSEKSELEKTNAQMNLTLGIEINQFITDVVLTQLSKGTKIVIEQPMYELVEKYNTDMSCVMNTLVFTSMLTNLNSFGNIVYSMATSLKKLGLWFKSPVIKKMKTICSSNSDNDDKVVELLNLISENDIVSSSNIESWAENFSKNENLTKLKINEELFNLLLPNTNSGEQPREADQDKESVADEEEASVADEEQASVAVQEDESLADEEEDSVADEEEASVADEEASVADEEASVADEEEVEFFEQEIFNPKKKKKITYLVTDDEHRDIYEQDDEGQPTDHVGRLVGKNSKAHFF